MIDKCYESSKPVLGFDSVLSYIPATVTASIEIRSSADAYQFQRLRWNNSCHLYLKLEQSDTSDKTTSIKTDNWDFSGWLPKPTNISEIIGKWPGDETDKEFAEIMREHTERD